MIKGIDIIIEKYYEGNTTIEEENILRSYLESGQVDPEHTYMIPLFKHFNAERHMEITYQPDLSFIKEQKSKIRFMWPKLITIAASFVILITVAFNWFESNNTVYKNKYTQLDSPEETEEALAITLNALGFLGKKFETGTKPMSHIKEYKRTEVYKTQ